LGVIEHPNINVAPADKHSKPMQISNKRDRFGDLRMNKFARGARARFDLVG
jgi:hypothetical protein